MRLLDNFSDTIKRADKAKKLDNRKKRQLAHARRERSRGKKESAKSYTKKARKSASKSRSTAFGAVESGVMTGAQGALLAGQLYTGQYGLAAKTFTE